MSERLNRIVTTLNDASGDIQRAAADVLVTSNLVPTDAPLPIPSVRFDEKASRDQWGIEGDSDSGFTVTIHPHDIEEFAARLGPKHVARMAHEITRARRQEGKEVLLREAIDTAKIELGLQLMANASLVLLLDTMFGVDENAVILEILRDASNQAHQRARQELLDAKRNLYFSQFPGG